WGASFPLALAAAGGSGEVRDAGRLVGSVAAANTLGAIAGALLVSLVAVGRFGSQATEQGLAAAAGLTALLLAAAGPAGWRLWWRTALGLAIGAGAAALVRLVPPVPPGLIAWGRHVDSWSSVDYRFVAEGQNASVAITWSNDCLNFHVAGKVEASTDPTDMR